MLKQSRAITPSLRHKIYLNTQFDFLFNKQLSIIKKKTGGRNNTGQITTRHIGGGHKKRILLIDHYFNKGRYSISKIKNLIYDANRNNYVMLCETKNNKLFLKLATENLNIGDNIYGKYYPIKNFLTNGSVTHIKNLAIGSKISNIEHSLKQGSTFVKAAGTYARIIKHENNSTIIKLPSKKIIKINSKNLCTIGSNSNLNFHNKILGKAGGKRWLGIRPTVRGEAMNPIDHPHGGKTSGGVRLKTVYGKLAKFIKHI